MKFELPFSASFILWRCVAPHVGAWIEISFVFSVCAIILSHPTWVRGLKFPLVKFSPVLFLVAPHVGAWIEILLTQDYPLSGGSHPTWVRGLK